MSVLGTWKITMASLFGSQNFTPVFSDNPPRGHMSGGDDGVMDVDGVVLDDNTATFTQDVTSPMKMHITWALTADVDSISSTAKAGIFPAQKVNGVRA